jgi:hypothetical protein
VRIWDEKRRQSKTKGANLKIRHYRFDEGPAIGLAI